jgi:serine/threonine protein kinase
MSHVAPKPRPSVRHRDPTGAALEACKLWVSEHPGKFPSTKKIRHIRGAFTRGSTSVRSFHRWFETHFTHRQLLSKNEIISKHRLKQGICTTAPSNISRDANRPFVCTLRCGQQFEDKNAWQKHEEFNHPLLWSCRQADCLSVFSRKDHFKTHLSKVHHQEVSKKDLDGPYFKIDRQFSPNCLFPTCAVEHRNWKSRCKHLAEHFKGLWNENEWNTETDRNICEEDSSELSDSDTHESGSDDESEGSDDDQDSSGAARDSAKGPNNGQGFSSAGFPPSRTDYSSQTQRNPGYGTSSQNGHQMHQHNYSTMSFTVQVQNQILNTHLNESDEIHQKPKQNAANVLLNISRRVPSSYLIFSSIANWIQQQDSEATLLCKTVKYQYTAENQRTYREVHITGRLQHPHVVRLIATYTEKASLTLITEPRAGYSLAQYLHTTSLGFHVERPILHWFGCLLSGLAYIHDRGIRHRDITPSSILIKDHNVFFADFSTSNMVSENESIVSGIHGFTKQYAAPEIWSGIRGRASDVWALGCVFLDIVSAVLRASVAQHPEAPVGRSYRPEEDPRHVRDLGAASERLATLRHFTEVYHRSAFLATVLDLCEEMLNPKPAERPGAAELARRINRDGCCSDAETPPLRETNSESLLVGYDRRVLSTSTVLSSDWESIGPLLKKVGMMKTFAYGDESALSQSETLVESYNDRVPGASGGNASVAKTFLQFAKDFKPNLESGAEAHKPPAAQSARGAIARYVAEYDSYQAFLAGARGKREQDPRPQLLASLKRTARSEDSVTHSKTSRLPHPSKRRAGSDSVEAYNPKKQPSGLHFRNKFKKPLRAFAGLSKYEVSKHATRSSIWNT